MGVAGGRLWYRWMDDHMILFAIISWGLWSSVGAWTYHYGDQSELNWEDARRYCQTFYTDLVAIQNKEEIDHLNRFLPFYPSYYWIGIRKINNTWTWVGTQKPLTKDAENWALREPNNRRFNQDCVEIYIKRNREAGKWNDERCDKLKKALCYKVVKCRELDAVHRPLLMNCSHPLEEFSYRSSCGFSCSEGFEMSGPATSQCLASGSWTAEPPRCVAVQCQPLNIPAHGDLSCSHIHGEFQYQSNCNFKCTEGFLVSGAETTVCDASGKWSSLEPTCQVMKCPKIESPTRGTMDCVNPIGNFAYNSTCDFACEAGFQLNSSKILHCSATGQWTSHVPVCHAVQCRALGAPDYGNSTCLHLHGEFQYQSSCTFYCTEGFLLLGEEVTQCTASGEWTAPIPICQVTDCPKLTAPENGELNCLHPHGDFAYSSSCVFSCNTGFVRVGTEQLQCTAQGRWTEEPPICKAMQCPNLQSPMKGKMDCSHPIGEFAYQSTCAFACEPGFALAGAKATHCLAIGNWSTPLPTCQVIECPKLAAPENGELNCSHPHGDFAYSSSCAFSCNAGFVQVGTEPLHCTALGSWTEEPPFCEAIKCLALHKPNHGHLNCLHPRGNFAYGSSCNFSCNAGFQLVGSEMLYCMALGDWTEQVPHCKAVQCPVLEIPANGNRNCTHPYGRFAYYSNCIFSCNSGFELVGSEKLKCTDQGNWTGDKPICEATKCPVLHAPMNGQLSCSHPYGNFTYNSSCDFSCDMGFVRAGSEMLNCMALGKWTRSVPVCEAIKCPQLRNMDNMGINCSNPWGSFSYRSSCHFHCAEGYLLNGTSRMQCQPDGHWSAEMPLCQENSASRLTQVLLYTGGVTASVVALVVSGVLIALAIRRFSKREGRRKLLSHTSDLGAPGVFTNAAFDS
ncbi:P-selectin isoform X2 [Elgaria multicarinata webbii]|uniref:P-selectin isoform X2 n=1 Tax=Elgaria multicarinata webbii TaxID=159646 RepID=UPI002FCCBE2C